MKHENINSYADKIISYEEFIKFTQYLRINYKEINSEWENNDLETYLDGIYGSTKSLEGYFYFKKEYVNLDNPTWRIMAHILLAARVYE